MIDGFVGFDLLHCAFTFWRGLLKEQSSEGSGPAMVFGDVMTATRLGMEALRCVEVLRAPAHLNTFLREEVVEEGVMICKCRLNNVNQLLLALQLSRGRTHIRGAIAVRDLQVRAQYRLLPAA